MENAVAAEKQVNGNTTQNQGNFCRGEAVVSGEPLPRFRAIRGRTAPATPAAMTRAKRLTKTKNPHMRSIVVVSVYAMPTKLDRKSLDPHTM